MCWHTRREVCERFNVENYKLCNLRLLKSHMSHFIMIFLFHLRQRCFFERRWLCAFVWVFAHTCIAWGEDGLDGAETMLVHKWGLDVEGVPPCLRCLLRVSMYWYTHMNIHTNIWHACGYEYACRMALVGESCRSSVMRVFHHVCGAWLEWVYIGICIYIYIRIYEHHTVAGRSRCCLHCNALQNATTHCNTLQHTATQYTTPLPGDRDTATHCNTLTHCSTLQHTATRCNTLQHTSAHCSTLQHTATHCNTMHQTVAGRSRCCSCVPSCWRDESCFVQNRPQSRSGVKFVT